MKIDKPSHLTGPEAAPAAAGPDKSGRAREADFAERLHATGAPEPASGTPAVGAASDPVADVAQDLRAGRISPDEAVHKVVELALERAGGAALPATVRERLRETLVLAVADDPVLATRARRVGAAVASLVPDGDG